MSTQAASAGDSLYTFLVHDHARFERLYTQLLEAMSVGSPDARAQWMALDHDLLAHLEAEERYVLPAFARVDAAAARALLKEHGEIREQLLELGVAMDLHTMRFERSHELIQALRAHAAREDHLLYRWADARLEDHLRAELRRHIRAR